MLVHAELTGHYDWAPCPPGTQITEADVKALRVKQMQNDQWHMRVECKRDTHTDANVPELAICDRMAALAALGRDQSREETAREVLAATYRHHFPMKHLVRVTVHDSGPDRDMFAAALAAHGVDGERAEQVMGDYLAGTDVEAFLNVAFKAKNRSGK